MSNSVLVQPEPGFTENLLIWVGAQGCNLGLRTLGRTELNSRKALQLPDTLICTATQNLHPPPSQRTFSGHLQELSELLAWTDGFVSIFKYTK